MPTSTIAPRSKGWGGRSWSYPHSAAALSGRQRRKREAWRKRLPWRWSNATSHTSSGRTATQSASRPFVHRDGPPGVRPAPKEVPPSRGRSRTSSSRRSAAEKDEVWPTWWRTPVPADHGVDGAEMLDLDPAAVAAPVRGVLWLGDHPVAPGALVADKPGGSLVRVGGLGCEGHLVVGRESRAEQGHALGKRPAAEVLVAARQQVKGDEGRRALRREHPHPRFGRMEAEVESVE